MTKQELNNLVENHNKFMESNGMCGKKVSFEDADLHCKSLAGKTMVGLHFVRANMRDTDLRGAEFKDCDLSYSDMNRAALCGARLPRELEFADLRNSNCRGVLVNDTHFWNADLRFADFSGAEINRANFAHADLRGADFSGATFTSACFYDCDVRGATFKGTQLSKCCFNNCDIRNTDFRRAELEGTTFEKSDLEGARFDKEEEEK